MTTRSGLVASPRKHVARVRKIVDVNSLLPCAITRPAPFSLKPLAGLFNPYSSKGCSLLCNHPNPSKHMWDKDGKLIAKTKADRNVTELPCTHDIPEEFFRRFTDTDSRPLTPTPSCATSARTRINGMGSHLSSTRRCVTPEPVSSDNHERKQIILDLRRSHSQETLYWNASSEMHQDSMSSSWLQSQSIKHEIEITNALLLKDDDIQELEEEEIEHEEIINEVEMEDISKHMKCINAMDEFDDDTMLRRGKRRKKSKSNILQTITFQPNNEPETQVAIAQDEEPDSPNISARPSLVPDSHAITPLPTKATRKADDFYNIDKSFFLDEDALRTLRMGLNVEIVECVFDRYRHRTLQEVLRTISTEKMGVDSEAVSEMKAQLNLPEMDYEKWMHLPRKFSRSSSRFELPMDLKELVRLTPLTYLSKFVFVDSDKKQLYHRIFTKYLPMDKATREEADNDEFFAAAAANAAVKRNGKDELLSRSLPDEALSEALKEVLSFHGSDENVWRVRSHIEFGAADEIGIDFRTFCGIVAFSERLLTALNQDEDPRNEIEIADFETLARHCHKVENEQMKQMFEIIQN